MDVQVSEKFVPQITGQVWLASRLLNRQVVNATTLEPVGRVADVVFDQKKCQVAAISIQFTPLPDSGWMAFIRRVPGLSRPAGYVTLDHIISLNGDVIVVDTYPGRATSPRVARLPHLREVCELAIITLHGVCLGSFADLLVDEKGSGVVGYVVNPAKQVEALMIPLQEVELAPPPFAERAAAATNGPGTGVSSLAVTGKDGESAQSGMDASLSHLCIIPASPRVRIGDSLIMVYEDIEPLGKETVVIASQDQPQGQMEAHVITSSTRHAVQ